MIKNDLLPIIPSNGKDDCLIIAGPCSAENEMQMLDTAEALRDIGVRVFRAGVWKPRTRPGGFEGHGQRALKWLAEVKTETGMLTSTEVGCAAHVKMALDAGVDILWIGARTSASPFSVQEIAEALQGAECGVLVKNPVCADVDLWIGAMERLYGCGLRRLAAIHRGFKTYGDKIYRNTPLWDVADEFRRQLPTVPILCDPSHMGGVRELIASLSYHAIDSGYDGLIVESHCNPENAITDSRQQITPAELGHLIAECKYRIMKSA